MAVPLVGQLQRQLGLAHPAQPGEGDGARTAGVVVQRRVDVREQPAAAHEGAVARGQVRGQDGAADAGQRIVSQHGGAHASQCRCRLDPQLIGQGAAAAVVGGQRVGLPARGVERADELDGHRLPQRVAGREAFQQRDVVRSPALAGVRVGQGLGRHHPLLLESRGDRGEERHLRLRARPESARPGPAGQGGLEQRRRVLVVAAGQRAAPRVDVGSEQVGVDGDRRAVQDVAVGAPGQRVRPEEAAQPGDVGLHGPDCRLDGPLTPDVVQQLLGRDRLGPADQDPREHTPLTGATQVHGVVADCRGEPAENPDHGPGAGGAFLGGAHRGVAPVPDHHAVIHRRP